jgi:flagellar biosynthetic protein FliR
VIDLPAQLLGATGDGLWHAAQVFLRVAALVALLPALGERSIPARIRLVVALGFTAIVAPAVPALPVPETVLDYAGAAGIETLIGLLLGIGLRLFVLALQTAGSIAAQSTSLAQLLGGAAADPIPAMGHVLVLAGLAIAVAAGLHVHAAELLILSYDLFPAGELPGARAAADWGARQVSRSFALAFTLAAPFAIASLVYNLALGAINRAMPQLMVAFVGAPAITFGGLALLLVTAPLMLPVWADALAGFAADPLASP